MSVTKKTNLEKLCAKHQITCASFMWAKPREGYGFRWTCVVGFAGRYVPVEYNTGTAHVVVVRGVKMPKSPNVADVLQCLFSDADSVTGTENIDDFAEEYCNGLSVSETLRVFEGCQKAGNDLRVLFADENLYDALHKAAGEH